MSPSPALLRSRSILRGFVALVSTAALGACGALPAAAAPVVASAGSGALRHAADAIMLLDAEAFEGLRTRADRPSGFDWTTDGCTLTPRGWERTFLRACHLHDFGYRNYGSIRGLRLGRDEPTRRWIDRRFRTEMLRVCARKRPGWRMHVGRQSCRAEASAMYLAVRGANWWGDS